MDSKLLLNSIIQKIVAGRSDWTLEELQYQKNNPQEIEVVLIKERLKTPVQCNCEGIMVVPCSWNVSMRELAKRHFHIKKFLFAPEAVALALYHNINRLNIDINVCIITNDTKSIEIGILGIGDGVFEVKSVRWLSTDEIERLPMVCDMMIKDLRVEENICQIILVDTCERNVDVFKLECIFQRPILQNFNLIALCNQGATLMQGVLNGTVKDMLLMSVIPQGIGISEYNGSMLQIIERDTTIPTRKTISTSISGSDLSIRQGNNAVANQNQVISTLHFHTAGISQRRQIEVTVDIDCNGYCRLYAKDTITGEVVQS